MLYTCRKCQTRVEGESIKVFGFHYHPTCFVCFDCNKSLSDLYFEIDRLPYCELDYKKPRPGQTTNAPKITIKKQVKSTPTTNPPRTFSKVITSPTFGNNHHGSGLGSSTGSGLSSSTGLGSSTGFGSSLGSSTGSGSSLGSSTGSSSRPNSMSLNIAVNPGSNDNHQSELPVHQATTSPSYRQHEVQNLHVTQIPSPHTETTISAPVLSSGVDSNNNPVTHIEVTKTTTTVYSIPVDTSNPNDKPHHDDKQGAPTASHWNEPGSTFSTTDYLTNEFNNINFNVGFETPVSTATYSIQPTQHHEQHHEHHSLSNKHDDTHQKNHNDNHSDSDSSCSSSSSSSCSTPLPAMQKTVEVFIPAPQQSTIQITEIPQPQSAPTIVSLSNEHNDHVHHDHHGHHDHNEHHSHHQHHIQQAPSARHDSQTSNITTSYIQTEQPKRFTTGYVDRLGNDTSANSSQNKTATIYTESNIYKMDNQTMQPKFARTVDGSKGYQVSYIDENANSNSRPPSFPCFKCNKEIYGTTIFNAQGDKFHPTCFSCYICRAPLTDAYFQNETGCVCAACQVILNDRNKFTRQQLGHCNICYKRFTSDESFISIDSEKYHKQCFKCTVCKTVITGLDYSRDRVTSSISNYCCFNCLDSGRADRCPECLGAIVGGASIFALGKTYHPQCFKCSKCKINIPHGTKFSNDSKHPTCSSCIPISNQNSLVV